MDEAEKVLERVDSLHLDFAKRAAVSEARNLIDDVVDLYFVRLWLKDVKILVGGTQAWQG